MTSLRITLALFAAASLAGILILAEPLSAVADEPANADEPAAAPDLDIQSQPVILRVNRNFELAGYVELEDDSVIVVRTTRGKLESFAKPRLLQIVRLVTPQPGQQGVVYMRNGQARRGIIIEDTFDHVTIEIESIRVQLRREIVDYVELEPTFEERYRDFKASIEPRMYERHLLLCRWLIDHRAYELAEKELRELIEGSEQEIPEARRLLRMVEAQLAMQASAAAAPEEPEEAVVEVEVDRGRLLTREEVNLIRVYEIDFDRPPRVSVRPETIRKMIEKYAASEVIPASQQERNALFRADPVEVVRMLFTLRARELYGEVQVDTEPPSMNLFRQRVHNTWLLQNCATSGCHGGTDAGALMLHRRGYQDERVRYTNFLILERLELDDDHRLINYEDPEMSLIIQYGLPREAARLPHPDVPGWRPVFTRGNERMKQDAIRWIKSMMQPRPDYPVDFEPPKPPEKEEVEDRTGGRIPR